MLFHSTVLVLSALSAAAAPATHFASVLTASSSATRDLPVGKTAISRSDMRELGRLAQAVNAAYCPQDRTLQPLVAAESQTHLGPTRHARRTPTSHRAASVLITSQDDEFAHLADDVDMSWYISHTPETQTLTLAFSSLPSVDALLETLAADPVNATEPLVDLPAYLFPPEAVATFPAPRMHHSFIPALESHGTAALLAVLDLLESPPAAPVSRANVLASYFLGAAAAGPAIVAAAPIKHVEITGHGMGAAVGLLTALALNLEVSGPAAQAYARPLEHVDVAATLFGLPRVGDQVFADWVDAAAANSLRVHRVSSYADTVAHLPARHLDLAHPSRGEIWVGADPRTAYVCRAAVDGTESDACAESIPLERTSLLDHAGPFGGVWVGANACRRAA